MPTVLAQAAITKYHRLASFYDKFIFHSSGGQKSKIKVPVDLFIDESSLPGLKLVAFSLCPLMSFLWCVCMETEREIFFPLLIKLLILSDQGHTLIGVTLFNLNYLLRPYSKYNHIGG